MQPMYYIGLDVHKRTISYCVKGGPYTKTRNVPGIACGRG
jgi:hypothetical protein